jgi:hypothetical protein
MEQLLVEIEDDRGLRLPTLRVVAIVAGTVGSIIAAFYLGGPALGMADASLCAGLLVLMAVRLEPRLPIVPPAARDGRAHLLLVASEPLEGGAAIDRVIEATGGGSGVEVLVLAPHQPRFAERWASDLDRGQQRAQRSLVLTVASLAKAGIDATARVGDEDVVQAVDDQLRNYPATEVVLVDRPADGTAESAAARQLRSRLRIPFTHLVDMAPRARTAAR